MRLLLLCTLAALLGWPTGDVTAHVLTLSTAETKARYEAYIIAGQLRHRPAISVRSSRRVSPHIVDVRVRYRFRDAAKTCRIQTIRVRFSGAQTRRLSVSFLVPVHRC